MKIQSWHFQIFESYFMLYMLVMYFSVMVDTVKCIFFVAYTYPLGFHKMCLIQPSVSFRFRKVKKEVILFNNTSLLFQKHPLSL